MVAAYSSSSCLHPRSSPDFFYYTYLFCVYVCTQLYTHMSKCTCRGQRATLWYWFCPPTMCDHLPGDQAWLHTDHVSNPPFLFLNSFILWLLDRGQAGGTCAMVCVCWSEDDSSAVISPWLLGIELRMFYPLSHRISPDLLIDYPGFKLSEIPAAVLTIPR